MPVFTRRFSFVLAAGIVLLLAGARSLADSKDGGGRGAVWIQVERPDVLVYGDGRFLGRADPENPLALAWNAGDLVLRLSAPGCGDLIGKVTVKAGHRQVFRARFAPPENPKAPPRTVVPVGPAQTLRLSWSEKRTAEPQAWTYFWPKSAGPAMTLVLADGQVPLIEVFDADGQALTLRLRHGDDLFGLNGAGAANLDVPDERGIYVRVSPPPGNKSGYSVLRMIRRPEARAEGEKVIGPRRKPPIETEDWFRK